MGVGRKQNTASMASPFVGGVSGFVVRRGENLCADLIDDVGGMELVAPVSFFACLSSSRY